MDWEAQSRYTDLIVVFFSVTIEIAEIYTLKKKKHWKKKIYMLGSLPKLIHRDGKMKPHVGNEHEANQCTRRSLTN